MTDWKYGTLIQGERGDVHMLIEARGYGQWMAITLVPDSSSVYMGGQLAGINERWPYATYDDKHGIWVPRGHAVFP